MKKKFVFLVISGVVFSFQFLFSASIGTVLWRCDVGPSVSSPAVGPNGTIYVGDTEGYLCAVNPDGKLKWRYKTGGAIVDSPALSKDGTVYFLNNEGFLYALNSNGTLKWRRRICYGMFQNQMFSVAVGEHGMLYSVNGYLLYAFNENGKLIWKKELDSHISTSPTIGTRGTIYVGTQRGKLYAISTNGEVEWKFSAQGAITSDISVSQNGTVYFGNANGRLYAVKDNGTLAWTFKTKTPVYLSVSIGKTLGGVVYFASGDTVYCLTADNGFEMWNYKIKEFSGVSSIAVGIKKSGEEEIYFADGKTVYALSAFGTKSWSLTLDTEIFSLPAMLENGELCLVSMGGYLYVVKTASVGFERQHGQSFIMNLKMRTAS